VKSHLVEIPPGPQRWDCGAFTTMNSDGTTNLRPNEAEVKEFAVEKYNVNES